MNPILSVIERVLESQITRHKFLLQSFERKSPTDQATFLFGFFSSFNSKVRFLLKEMDNGRNNNPWDESETSCRNNCDNIVYCFPPTEPQTKSSAPCIFGHTLVTFLVVFF